MPQKKSGAPKKTRQSAAKKKSTADIPSLVFNEASFKTTKKKPLPETPGSAIQAYETVFTQQAQAKRWMWIGVGSFLLMISILWGWSLKLQIASFRWSGSAEEKFLEENKKNWTEAFKPIASSTPTETPQAKIKETIALILEASSTTTATTTATSTTPTTTQQ